MPQIDLQIRPPRGRAVLEGALQPRADPPGPGIVGIEDHRREAVLRRIESDMLPDQLRLRLERDLVGEPDRIAALQRSRGGMALQIEPDAAVRARLAVEPGMHQNAVEIPAAWTDMGPVESQGSSHPSAPSRWPDGAGRARSRARRHRPPHGRRRDRNGRDAPARSRPLRHPFRPGSRRDGRRTPAPAARRGGTRSSNRRRGPKRWESHRSC